MMALVSRDSRMIFHMTTKTFVTYESGTTKMTFVRLLSSMSTLMLSKIILHRERGFALVAFIRLIPRMSSLMLKIDIFTRECGITLVTLVGFIPSMSSRMFKKNIFSRKCGIAQLALIGFITSMCKLVRAQPVVVFEGETALGTRKQLAADVNLLMLTKGRFIRENQVAAVALILFMNLLTMPTKVVFATKCGVALVALVLTMSRISLVWPKWITTTREGRVALISLFHVGTSVTQGSSIMNYS